MALSPEQSPDQWVAKYGEYLMRYAIFRLRDPARAEDAVQETFLAALRNLDRYDGKVEIKYWLRGILRNKIVDIIRKSVRETPLEEPETYDRPDDLRMRIWGLPSDEPKPWKFEPHQAFEEEEFWRIFREAVDELKSPIREAFVLRELEGISSEEVCKALDITPNNLWVMIHRARAQLKSRIEEQWNR